MNGKNKRMNNPCPFCKLSGGFHDEEIHDKIAIPAEKLLPTSSSINKANEGICGNCGASYSQIAIFPCRNPNHAKATND
jgi:hypothetical protein